jgi:hypothetical protein
MFPSIPFNKCLLYFTLYSAAQPQVSTVGTNDDNLDTTTPAVPTPQSLRMIATTNERDTQVENIAESSFTEPAAAMKYRIRLVEDIDLLTDGNRKIVSKCEAGGACRGSAGNLKTRTQ